MHVGRGRQTSSDVVLVTRSETITGGDYSNTAAKFYLFGTRGFQQDVNAITQNGNPLLAGWAA